MTDPQNPPMPPVHGSPAPGTPPVVGVLGAGRAGTAFARVLLKAGYGVDIANTRPPKALRHHLTIHAPGARAVDPADVAARTREQDGGVVVLAVPQEELDEVDPAWVAGTVLVDATNTWQDEILPTWLEGAVIRGEPTSSAVAEHFDRARTVKALNHISHSEFDDAAQLDLPVTQRRALGVAGDDDAARGRVMALLEAMGFDPVSLGPLAAGVVLQPDGPLFNQPLRRGDLLPHAR
ncbi:NADPH-dependent F420 reductase [Nesterenkonia sp. F]|uniref:NADPH-dependent F420 reductase n=1 Tax=Nesterenkonia sp. F TaxID=795955 RepID=UPI001ED8F25C|nr:NAD(P)-binding domain-containing protein [Nesterenkonia sp. F]